MHSFVRYNAAVRGEGFGSTMVKGLSSDGWKALIRFTMKSAAKLRLSLSVFLITILMMERIMKCQTFVANKPSS